MEIADGWWLRHAPGSAWWAGSVLPHSSAEASELVRRIAQAEEFYADRGAPARFQITPGACPEELDMVLAERGYRRHSEMSLQVTSALTAEGRIPVRSLRLWMDDRPTQAWLDVWHRVHGAGIDLQLEVEMLNRVQLPSAYASAAIGDHVVAVGRAVAHGGWAGIFGMATLPEARGEGAARAVLSCLARWTDDHGADRMYLQVERDNTAALSLYRQAGFSHVCTYHYRSAGLT